VWPWAADGPTVPGEADAQADDDCAGGSEGDEGAEGGEDGRGRDEIGDALSSVSCEGTASNTPQTRISVKDKQLCPRKHICTHPHIHTDMQTIIHTCAHSRTHTELREAQRMLNDTGVIGDAQRCVVDGVVPVVA
jgi:hypothetical protein